MSMDKMDLQNQFKTWVEKYRPCSLKDVIYQNEIIDSLQNIIKNNALNLPNFLFHGPPGTGKTSAIVALSKEIFRNHFKNRVLELNASDERGIQVIREKVKHFAQQTIANEPNIPSIKIIILDECDSMTKDAQSALRRIMEKYSNTTRFCLICNYLSRIIDPIVSRCSVYRFKSLRTDLIKKTLKTICENEKVQLSDDVLDTLIETSEGDLRKAITSVQTLSMIFEENEIIKIDDVLEIVGQIPQSRLESFFNSCRSNSFNSMMMEVSNIIKSGYSGLQFLNQLQHWIALADPNLLNDAQKSKICSKIAMADKYLLDGSDEYIQLLNIGSNLFEILNSNLNENLMEQ
ncbi:replication factor C subunit 4-like protein [Sarcoptes scabiei]|uniref:Replication factor C subunit 4-like protein n=1 Tax=Sarcoptes scabiei TaxID=52283 RepID=A0A131ZTE0_SARSC|nr:replication factor C subunit 4-like protein [Sarcoptes scabiei]